MRSHHTTSKASSSREKCTRPLVVGPSPVITPSRTMASARAAVSRQEISEGSRAAAVSAEAANEADIRVTLLSFLFWARRTCGRKRVVNDSKPDRRDFYRVADLSL